MKIQEQQPSEMNIQQIFQDSKRREVVVKSLLQALSTFGYHQTIKSLEKQSRIQLEDERIANVQSSLKRHDYNRACKQIEEIDLAPASKLELFDSLQKLQLLYLMSLGDVEAVIEGLSTSKMAEENKLKFYQMIGLDNFSMEPSLFETQHNQILQKCQSQQRNQKDIKNVLSSYLIDDSVDPFKRRVQAPKLIVSENEGAMNISGRVSFIKFSPSGNELILVSQCQQFYELSLWKVKEDLVIKKETYKSQSIGCITSVKWSQHYSPMQGWLIGICSYSVFSVFRTNKFTVLFTIKCSELQLPKFLCFAWNPISEFIYLGGLYSQLIGLDSQGEIKTEVNPFICARQLAFSPEGNLFAIGSFKSGHLIKYCLNEQKIEKEFTAKSLFMDLKYHQKKIIVTNRDSIFVLDSTTLDVIYTIDSPTNEKAFKIEAFICGPWVIVYNERLRATLQIDRLLRQVKWENCDAVDVFDKRMVTCSSSIKIWQAPETDQLQEQYQSIESVQQDRESSESSSSSQEEPSSSEEDQDDIQRYKQLMEIEFQDNGQNEDQHQ